MSGRCLLVDGSHLAPTSGRLAWPLTPTAAGRCATQCQNAIKNEFEVNVRRIGGLSSRNCHQLPTAAAPADSEQPRLSGICREIQLGFFELCVQNSGRTAAAALSQVVTAAAAAFQAGYGIDRLRLELEHGSHSEVDAAGYRLTESERQYRAQWLDTVYVTLQLHSGMLNCGDVPTNLQSLRPWVHADAGLLSTVSRTLHSHQAQDPNAVRFDRSLATAGASGGAASESKTIAPQFVPVSQLVLMTLQTLRQEDSAQ